MNNFTGQEMLEELTRVRPEVLNEDTLKLYNTIMQVIDERDLYKSVLKEIREYVLNHIHQETFTGYMDSYELKHLVEIIHKGIGE